MATVVSVDLALKHYADIGIAVLVDEGKTVRVQFERSIGRGTTDPPTVPALVSALLKLVEKYDASVLMLDGPQAWKDPDNGISHMRICERELVTPAKTGLPDQVKPATYLPFVAYSIAVFDALRAAGLEPLAQREPRIVPNRVIVLESFPSSAWKGLKLPPLPAKAKSKWEDISQRIDLLRDKHSLVVDGKLSHDELQAVVSGLAGIAIVRQAVQEYSVHGVAPRVVDGIWREGFIATT